MRTSILSRSVIAVASLAIGSVALAAVPADAATPSGITRDSVLSLAASARANATSVSTRAAARDILNRECALAAGESITATETTPFVTSVATVSPSETADGASISGFVSNAGGPVRQCVVGVIAPTAPGFALSGQATLSVTLIGSTTPVQVQTAMSGDVSVSAANKLPNVTPVSSSSYSVAGTASKTSTVTTSTKVKDRKTSKEKKAAKKKYGKKVKALKKSYKKALAKAGGSKTKKKAAKKSYSAKRTAAKNAYRYAIAGYKIVKKTRTVTDNRTFTTKADQTNQFL